MVDDTNHDQQPPAIPGEVTGFMRWCGWAMWLTAFVFVIGPCGCVAYLAGAVFQITLAGWSQGRADHTGPDASPRG